MYVLWKEKQEIYFVCILYIRKSVVKGVLGEFILNDPMIA